MRAGEIVITGSALRTRFAEAGDEVTYRIDGLGEASGPRRTAFGEVILCR